MVQSYPKSFIYLPYIFHGSMTFYVGEWGVRKGYLKENISL